MRLFDTHCHLDDEQFDSNRDAVVQRAKTAGVTTILAVGTSAASSLASVALAKRYACVLAAVGIQPNYCAEASVDDWDEVAKLAESPQVVAIGETGLDRHWDHTPFDVQEDYFDRHLRLSQRRKLPFIVHLRDCEEDVLRMLREASERGPLQGVMHSYTGTAAGAAECVELGLYLSFAGMVTYKKSEELREIARSIPEDRILIETDAPYLSPHPRRDQRPNEPALIVHTAACLADTRGTPIETFGQLTTANANRLFNPRR